MIKKLTYLIFSLVAHSIAPVKEYAKTVEALGFYVNPEYFKNPSIIAPALRTRIDNDSLELPNLKIYLEEESLKRLAESKEYDTGLQVEFKVSEPLMPTYLFSFPGEDVDQYIYNVEEKMAKERKKIAPSLTIQRKRSTLSGRLGKWFGHDWFQVSGPEFAVKIDWQSFGAIEPLPDEKITLRGFFCRYGPNDNTLSFPGDLYQLAQLLDLSKGVLNHPVFIYEADFLNNYRWQKVNLEISRSESGVLEMKLR